MCSLSSLKTLEAFVVWRMVHRSNSANWWFFGSNLRTPALKTEKFSKKSVVLVKRGNGFTKKLFSLFFWVVFCPEAGFIKSMFAFY